ncbi:MAG: hypothetical protein Q4A74_07750 [Cardiobacteriaceae bacterium]|nr:hypothetical protein [Cardiobacteriaceae bacterium]
MTPYEQQEYYRDMLNKRAHDIYSLFLIGALIGWLTIPIGSILAYQQQRKVVAGMPVLSSHFRYQMFSSVWMVVALMLGIGGYIGLRHFDPQICVRNIVFNPPKPRTYFLVCYILVFYMLWITRFCYGYKMLSHHIAIANPYTLWLPRGSKDKNRTQNKA